MYKTKKYQKEEDKKIKNENWKKEDYKEVILFLIHFTLSYKTLN